MMETIISEIMKFVFSEQIFIATLGVAAVWLSQSENSSHHRWASVAGLIGQPFWFYMAYNAQAWGVFILCILYTWAWLKGFKKYWIKIGATT